MRTYLSRNSREKNSPERLRLAVGLWRRRAQAVATSTILLMVALFFPAAAICQFSFAPSICVETGDIDQYKPDIACADDGAIFIIWVSYDSAQIRISKSTDGGESFLPSIPVAPLDNFPAVPRVALDASGNPMVVWPAFHIFTDSRVLFTRSTDGGSTFLAPMAIDSVNLHSQEGPAIATDASGNPHIVWVGERIPPTLVDIYYSRSTDGGETFSPAIAVDSSFLEQREPSITVDSDGNLFVAYTQGPMLDHTEIYVAKSKDGGFSFTQKRLAEPFSSLCSLPVIKASSQPAVTNETMLVWSDYRSGPCKNVYFTKSTDGGMTFQYPIAVDSGDYEQVSSGLAVDSQGCPAVAWREWDMGFSWAFVAYSDDQGNTFSAPQRVDEYLDASMDEPRICFSKEGDLLVTWEDVRPTTGLRVRFARGVRTGIAERVHGKGGAPLTVETYPNPSSGEIFVRCGTGSDSSLSVAIYDVAGRVADVPVHGPHVIADGQSLFVIESSRGYLEAGVYFVVVRCSREQKEVRGIQKVVVLR